DTIGSQQGIDCIRRVALNGLGSILIRVGKIHFLTEFSHSKFFLHTDLKDLKDSYAASVIKM
ncbi:MAG: hypothetical protein SPG89_04025, partial [Prevotella sp.]|nr:hypothetical protein [Prevotella sp.]